MHQKEDELVQVWTTKAGTPERMVWRGKRYLVSDRPVPWVRRQRWWEHLQAEEELKELDLVLWRFQITPVAGESPNLVVDVYQKDNGWLLFAVHE